MRHVVKDLVLEALLDDARRRLARAEAGHARLARIVARDPVDLGCDHVARDFDAHVLARRVDFDEFGFHNGIVFDRRMHRATASCPRAVR